MRVDSKCCGMLLEITLAGDKWELGGGRDVVGWSCWGSERAHMGSARLYPCSVVVPAKNGNSESLAGM